MKRIIGGIAYLVILKFSRKAFGHSIDQSTEGESSIAEEKDREKVIQLLIYDCVPFLQEETISFLDC